MSPCRADDNDTLRDELARRHHRLECGCTDLTDEHRWPYVRRANALMPVIDQAWADALVWASDECYREARRWLARGWSAKSVTAETLADIIRQQAVDCRKRADDEGALIPDGEATA